MGKVKDKKRANKKAVLKAQRKGKEGGTRVVTDTQALDAEVREHARTQARLNIGVEAAKKIVAETEGSRWKEAKAANALARDFLLHVGVSV